MSEDPSAGEKLPLARKAFDGCFGCGPANAIGLKLEFSRDGDSVVARTVLARDYVGYREFAHGGVVATLLDEAMGWAMYHIVGRHGVTRGLNVVYRRPVTVERGLELRGTVLEARDRDVRLQSTLSDERGRLLASAEGDWVAVRDERAAAEPS